MVLGVEELEDVARRGLARWNVPGLALGLLRAGAVETLAVGVADVESGAPVTPETRFRIASITKPFTATLALTLVEEGRLDLDAPLPGGRSRATLRQLLSHRPGLECEWPRPLDTYGDGDDALARLVRDEPAPGPVGAGELFSYCNAGFWVVGGAVAEATGTTFEHAMHERVLEPLSLDETAFEPRGPFARGHEQVAPGGDEHRPASGEYPRVRRPSGGLFSTVHDLLAFAAHHLGEPGPLGKRCPREMQSRQADVPGGAYGLGWALREAGGRRIVEHAGSALGYQSLLLLVPSERLALAVLTNSSRGRVVTRGILAALALAADGPRARGVREGELAALAGRYRFLGGEVEVEADDGRLSLRVSEVDPFTRRRLEFPPLRARAAGGREFVVVGGEDDGERIDFPRAGLVRVGGVLAARVER